MSTKVIATQLMFEKTTRNNKETTTRTITTTITMTMTITVTVIIILMGAPVSIPQQLQ